MTRNAELSNPEPEEPVLPQEPSYEEQASAPIAVDEEPETPQNLEKWDPRNLTLDQIASVKYRPLAGKG